MYIQVWHFFITLRSRYVTQPYYTVMAYLSIDVGVTEESKSCHSSPLVTVASVVVTTSVCQLNPHTISTLKHTAHTHFKALTHNNYIIFIISTYFSLSVLCWLCLHTVLYDFHQFHTGPRRSLDDRHRHPRTHQYDTCTHPLSRALRRTPGCMGNNII